MTLEQREARDEKIRAAWKLKPDTMEVRRFDAEQAEEHDCSSQTIMRRRGMMGLAPPPRWSPSQVAAARKRPKPKVTKPTRMELKRRLLGNTGIDRKALEAAMHRQAFGEVALSKASGVSRETVWKLCNELRKPRLATVLKLARALRVCPLTLVRDPIEYRGNP